MVGAGAAEELMKLCTEDLMLLNCGVGEDSSESFGPHGGAKPPQGSCSEGVGPEGR